MLGYIRKKYSNYVIKPYLQWYLSKPRYFAYNDIRLKIYPTVFHPKYFFSTLFFVEFVQTLSLNGKRVCELGAGSGLLSFIAVKQGANAVAIDLNEIAVKGLRENLRENNVDTNKLHVVQSDLFNSVKVQEFDLIFINPPYFFSDAGDISLLAWNCGANGEFFSGLFAKLGNFCHPNTGVYMSLADNCDLKRIENIASEFGYRLECAVQRKIKWEKNFIFKVKQQGVKRTI